MSDETKTEQPATPAKKAAHKKARTVTAQQPDTAVVDGKSAAQIAAELAYVQLETARLNLDAARDDNARRTATKADTQRKNRQRQQQLANDRNTRRAQARACNHLQGATPEDPLQGAEQADTALKVVNMPDGFTQLIMCSNCRGRWFSPHPTNKSKKLRPGETPADRDARIELYEQQVVEFAELLRLSKRAKTREYTKPMECGVTIQVMNEDGMPVYRERPCDSYAGM